MACTNEYIQSFPKASRNLKRSLRSSSADGQSKDDSRVAEKVSYQFPSIQHHKASTDRIPKQWNVGLGVSGEFGKDLADSFYECLHQHCPVVQWEPFYQELLVAGFDAPRMRTPETEVLCLVVQAFGARVVSLPWSILVTSIFIYLLGNSPIIPLFLVMMQLPGIVFLGAGISLTLERNGGPFVWLCSIEP
jgi:hypothetical protein